MSHLALVASAAKANALISRLNEGAQHFAPIMRIRGQIGVNPHSLHRCPSRGTTPPPTHTGVEDRVSYPRKRVLTLASREHRVGTRRLREHGAWLVSLRRHDPSAKRLVVMDGGEMHLVAFEDIRSISADGNYVVVETGARKLRTRERLKAVAALLDERFVQIRRDSIVNLEHVVRVTPVWAHGQVRLHLDRGHTALSGREYTPAVRQRLLPAPHANVRSVASIAGD